MSSSVVMSMWALQAWAQSIVPESNGTGTVVNSTANQFDIDGGQISGDGANLFHSFERFGLNGWESANFLASPQVQNIFGRVMGGNASSIDGLLRITGGNANLFLMNPSGIVFGPNVQLNVPAAFTVTTANGIGFGGKWWSAVGGSDYGKLVGSPDSLAFTLSQPGAIANFGNLSVGDGQALTLMGGAVLNTGSLKAPGGSVTVSAVPGGQVARITPVGSLVSLEVPVVGNQPQGWTLPVSGLPQLITGSGLTHANQVEVKPDGSLWLVSAGKNVPSGNGTAIVAGTIDTVNVGVGKSGGVVTVTGDRVGLVGAQVDASGNAGGGNVRIGGEFQGKGAIPNAAQTHVDEGSRIKVDALDLGNGGRAIVWSDRSTVFNGDMSVRGGRDGNGGLGEISGRDGLSFDGKVDLAAPYGKVGQVLFDPKNITIVDGDGAQDGIVKANSQVLAEVNNSDFVIGKATLQGLNGDITLQASENIQLNTSLFFPVASAGRTIQFNAGGAFIGGDNSLVARAQNIEIKAASIQIGKDLDTRASNTSSPLNSGNIKLTSTSAEIGNIVTADLLANGQSIVPSPGNAGNIILDSAKDISTGKIEAYALTQDAGRGIRAGNITLVAAGDVVVRENIYAGATEQNNIGARLFSDYPNLVVPDYENHTNDLGQGGNVSITAGKTIKIQDQYVVKEYVQNPSLRFLINLDRRCQGASICTSGQGRSGNITLTYGKLLTTEPDFSIGSFAINGSKGSLVSGSNIQAGSVPLPPLILSTSEKNGTIKVVSEVAPPPPSVAPPPPSVAPPLLPLLTLPPITKTEKCQLDLDTCISGRNKQQPVLKDSSKDNWIKITTDLEAEFTSEYEKFLGVKSSGYMNTQQIQARLKEINRITGTQNALVYMFFKDKGKTWEWFKNQGSSSKTDIKSRMDLENDDDTLGMSLLTEDAVIPIPFIDSQTGAPSICSKSNCLESAQLNISGKTYTENSQRALTRGEVLNVIHEFRQELMIENSEEFSSRAEKLYDWFIKPIKEFLPEIEKYHLSFIVNPSIGAFPIGALSDSKTKRFLAEETSLSFMPSFSLVDTRIREKPLSESSVLAMGASEFENNQHPLPAKLSIDTLEKIWCSVENQNQPSCQESKFFNATQDFTVDKLKPSFRGNLPIVYLVTHGKFQSGSPDNSHIYVFQGNESRRDTKKFAKASEFPLPKIESLRLDLPSPPPIELLFLSACETAYNSPEAGLSFAGSAMKSKVKSVIAVSGNVEVARTFLLSMQFFEELKYGKIETSKGLFQSMTKAKALQRAQKAMINGEISIDSNLGALRLRSLQSNMLTSKYLTYQCSDSDDSCSYILDQNLTKQQLKHPRAWADLLLIGNPW